MNKLLILLIAAAFAIRSQVQAQFVRVESPNDSVGQDGNAATGDPFIGRYQQVYAASDFGAISNAGGALLNELSFRIDASGFGFGMRQTNVQINFSTTQRGPDSLSPVFADNIGPDNMMVLQSSVLPITAAYSVTASPQPYEVQIVLNQPFFYNPANGNLLMDVRVFGGRSGTASPFDGWNRVGDSVGRVFGGMNDTTGTFQTIGVATRFGFTSVPEPSSFALFALAGGVLAFALRK